MQRRIVHSFHNTLQTCILTTSQRSCWNAGTIVCFYMRIDARPLRETGFYCFILANMATVTWSFKYYIYNPPLCNAKYIYSGVVRCGVVDWDVVRCGVVRCVVKCLPLLLVCLLIIQRQRDGRDRHFACGAREWHHDNSWAAHVLGRWEERYVSSYLIKEIENGCFVFT